MVARLLRNPVVWLLSSVLLAGVVFGLYWFQPWKLFTDRSVSEVVPTVATSAPAAPTSGPVSPAGNQLLASGRFISHEHDTTGAVQLVRLADGSRRLVLRDLSTSNGPDLRVWLTDRKVVEGRGGWRVFDDGEWIELGRLKGNKGNQSYSVPATVELDRFASVSIWCKRFSVSFGAATLVPL